MQFYIISVAAVLLSTSRDNDPVIDYRHDVWACSAEGEIEAKHKAMDHAKAIWPESAGWYGHSAKVEALPENMLMDAWLSARERSDPSDDLAAEDSDTRQIM